MQRRGAREIEPGGMQLLLGEVGEGARPRLLQVEEHGVRQEGRVDRVVGQAQSLHERTSSRPRIGVEEALEALEPHLQTEAQMLDYASLNEGRASDFGVARLYRA